jgi:MOSC domain-containing protein YiiM
MRQQETLDHSIRAVLVGKVRKFAASDLLSGIDKQPIHDEIKLDWLGLAGDEQADLRVHGGSDKAVHFYPWPHYDYWRNELGELKLLERPGAFGENFSVDLTETDVCIGDRWQVGTAELEVSQGRQPCWKLNLRFGVTDMAKRVQETQRAGWYCRVLSLGRIDTNLSMTLLHRPHPDWSIARLLAVIRDRECSNQILNTVLQLPLTPSWQKLFQRRADTQSVEDWSKRMQQQQ